jgi:transcriptional regulator with XRE-family HTH domain
MSTDSPARAALRALPGRAADLAYLSVIGERVREVRARRGMSRRILARDSGVSERYLASLEAGRGNVSILLLKQIAQAMDVPVEQLAQSLQASHEALVARSAGGQDGVHACPEVVGELADERANEDVAGQALAPQRRTGVAGDLRDALERQAGEPALA